MKRRIFLQKIGCAAAGVPFWMGIIPENLQAKVPPGLKITNIKSYIVRSAVYVKIYTNEGLTGIGQGNINSMERAVDGAVKDLGEYIIGRNAADIEFLWQVMWKWPRARGGALTYGAISALDIALWDILGKAMDVPIYRLLGGAARDRVRVYTHAQGSTPEEMTELTLQRMEEGYTAIRTSIPQEDLLPRPWNFKKAVAHIEAMRKAAGDDVDILIDAHGRMTPVQTLEFANAVEQYRIMFIEDPVVPENLGALKWIGDHTEVPLGIGENHYSKFDFRDIIFNNLARYVRPDALWAGGITECKKIAAMADAFFIDVVLHGGGTINSFAATHISASTPNCVMQEPRGGRASELFYGADITLKNGYVELPTEPGLGCDLNEDYAKAQPYNPGSMPKNIYPDGSPSDW
ncbi:mandelate racemase/muconate lactonizing enzyme family protein [Candidatus Latescibacterota bacterium]